MKTRLFAYLDQYKMYSISSQIFEGLTEYALKYSEHEIEEVEEQKGPVGSGRLLADIVGKRAGESEKRFMHDYAYTLFEEKLMSEGRVCVIDDDLTDDVRKTLAEYGFVKVIGKMAFHDVPKISRLAREFNTIGEALAYVSSYGEISSASAELEKEMNASTGNRKKELRKQLKSLANPADLAKSAGLYQDPTYMEKLAYMLDLGYRDSLEVQIMPSSLGYSFSAPLTRENLREPENLLVMKYGRYTEATFALFGVLTQTGESTSLKEHDVEGFDIADQDGGEPQSGGIKLAFRGLNESWTAVEETFTGRLENEFIIDPIAIYREI